MSPTAARRRTASAVLLLALILALPLQACAAIGGGRITAGSSPYLHGSGVKTTVQRTVGTYHAISASTGVTVTVEAGDPGSASVTADDNLVDHITTVVRDGTLYVAVDGGVQTDNELSVRVANSGLDAISASTGSTVDAESLSASAMEVEASTGATVRGGGTTDSLTLTADTGATADLRNLEASAAVVAISVGATAHVHPTQSVTGECTGGATLLIDGHPAQNDVTSDGTSTVKEGQ
jgi:hypothetical protein